MDVLAFDIETGSASELFSYGPGFIRLCGWKTVGNPDQPTVSTDPADLVKALRSADAITGHNIINYDLLALSWHGYLTFDEYEQMCRKSFDTLIVDRQLDPVAAKGAQESKYYSLAKTLVRYRAGEKDTVDFEGKRDILRRIRGDAYAAKMKPGKTTEFGVLDILEAAYGGYDKIPQDDPDYVRYLDLDVDGSGNLFVKMASAVRDESPASQRYIRREHYVATSMGRVTLEGMRTDTDLTMKRWAEGQARLEAGKRMLHEKYGMPTEGKKPHTSNPGKAAFRNAILEALGCSEEMLDERWPLALDGSLKTGKDVLDEFIPIFEQTRPAAAELCRTIKAMNGERTIYGTVLDHLVDDRVHPYIGPDQASGRWSMKDPGLTVFGKRGGKARERAIMLADNDDEVLVAIDADQVDARVIAAECQDPQYMALFAPGMDLHSEVAWRVWPDMHKHGEACHTPVYGPHCGCGVATKCHCDLRDRAKVCGHGFSYGLGARGMSVQNNVELEVAQGFITGMTEAFPRLAEWKDEVRQLAGVLGYDEEAPANDTYRILYTWAGRPVRVERNRAYTQATALVGQGGTRDVMAEAILKLPPHIRRKVRAVIHDEIVLSLPKEGAQEAAQAIADGMAFDLKGVRITFGCSRVSRSWAGCYGEQYEQAA